MRRSNEPKEQSEEKEGRGNEIDDATIEAARKKGRSSTRPPPGGEHPSAKLIGSPQDSLLNHRGSGLADCLILDSFIIDSCLVGASILGSLLLSFPPCFCSGAGSLAMSESPPPPPWSFSNMTNNAVQFLRLPVLASSGLAVVASGLLYFKQK